MAYGNCGNKYLTMAAFMDAHAAARTIRDFMPCRTSVRDDRLGQRHRRKSGGYGYTVNLDGRRESATRTDGKTWAYTYDALNQVTAGVLSDGNTPVSSHTYAYDLIGNRTSSTNNGVTQTYTANDLNQYAEVDSVEFSYDADGNLLSDGQFTYEYDAQNQLVSVSTETEKQVFIYDFMGRRIATESYFKSGNDWIKTTRRRYIYQGWNVIAEYVNGARNKTYIWGEDLSGELQGAGGVGGMLLEQNACGDYLPVYDGNGNIIAYKNEEGSVVSTYAYDPFGNVIAHAGMDFAYKFSTKPQDELSGMYYYGYRFYQPELGRWINRDPIREAKVGHLYVFANNGAVNSWDKVGLFYGPLISDAFGISKYDALTIAAEAEYYRKHGVYPRGHNDNTWIATKMQEGYLLIKNGAKQYRINNKDCGSGWFTEVIVPDSPFGFKFKKCCENHDKCYDLKQEPKKCCDKKFLKCMLQAVANEDTPWYRPKFVGQGLALIYYGAVVLFGSLAYGNSK